MNYFLCKDHPVDRLFFETLLRDVFKLQIFHHPSGDQRDEYDEPQDHFPSKGNSLNDKIATFKEGECVNEMIKVNLI